MSVIGLSAIHAEPSLLSVWLASLMVGYISVMLALEIVWR